MWAMYINATALVISKSLASLTAAAQPGEGALDHPAAGKELKPFGDVGSLNDLDGPFSNLGRGDTQFVDGITPVREGLLRRC
jgi:hypothetical protein